MEFAEEYLVLKPLEGSLWDLLRLLFSQNFGNSKFVECSEGMTVHGLKNRWVLVVSPMFWLGLIIETLTFTGPRQRHQKRRQSVFGALSTMAAKPSYENEALIKATVTDKWKMKFLYFYDFWNDYQHEDESPMQAFMFQDKTDDHELIVVAFRGIEPFDVEAWSSDIDISWYDLLGFGKVHGGFMKALGLQKGLGWPRDAPLLECEAPVIAFQKLTDILKKNEKAKVIVTRHSLGGALAVVFPIVLAIKGIYTFGQPRIGDEKTGEFVKEQFRINGIKYFRYVYCNDIVPRSKHFGTCLYFNSLYQGKFVEEEPNKNYFNPAKYLHKILNACFEMIRSFFIGYIAGPEYSEGWFLRLFRVFGLIIPTYLDTR
ncbi:hypothetical protein MKW92_048253 [Papaver armeniacum]|nr:hypothetical protein MKW92_048253 [Papaver armeniacum]